MMSLLPIPVTGVDRFLRSRGHTRAMANCHAPIPYKISHLSLFPLSPQRGSLAWFKVMIENRSVILRIILDSFTKWRGSAEAEVLLDFDAGA